jgi:hypothetical protein
MDIPHKERTGTEDQDRPRTKMSELLERYGKAPPKDFQLNNHHSIWITEDILELCKHFNSTFAVWRDDDDKTGREDPPKRPIGFTIVLQKQ